MFEFLQHMDGYIFMEPNRVVEASTVQNNPPSWGLERVWKKDLPLTNEYRYSHDGEGVDIYVADTGIYCDHNDFGNRCTWGYTAPGVDGGDADCNGHGTHCAGTAAGTLHGVAKNANLIAVKVLGCSGSGSFSGIISGMEYVANQYASTKRPTICSMSLGGGRSSSVNAAVDAMSAAGVHNAIAAGNDGYQDACTRSPAGAGTSFTVASTTSSDQPSSFSNVGTCVDIWAPGSSITSAWIGNPNAVRTISGTSMATPHVAGAMAIALDAMGDMSVKELGELLVANAGEDKITYGSNVLLNRTPNKNLFTDPQL
jgi:subtilisin family serine protease